MQATGRQLYKGLVKSEVLLRGDAVGRDGREAGCLYWHVGAPTACQLPSQVMYMLGGYRCDHWGALALPCSGDQMRPGFLLDQSLLVPFPLFTDISASRN